MPIIPYGTKHRVTVSASTWKPITCQHCGCKFAYKVSRTATDSSTNFLWLEKGEEVAKRARVAAERNLESQLEQGNYSFACPDCGKYQAKKVKQLQSSRLIEGFLTALLFTVILCFTWLIIVSVSMPLLRADVNNIVYITLVIGGLVLGIRHYVRHDPSKIVHPHPRNYSEEYPVMRKADIEAAAIYIYQKEGRLIEIPKWE
jgi:predicted RNA-binding Zn-ribbon protein involved in translation (DUF1610 family)